ncbi:MAG: chemotaxis protein CheR, partial [bacterium]|nr:chemotaxis protein CheR [bacterium]
QILERAMRGVYTAADVEGVPRQLLSRYFERIPGEASDDYRVGAKVRALEHFGRVNLTGPWPMCGPFDVIFCRNVMIYFDRQTQIELVERYRSLLATGGTLFIGHSESLAGKATGFRLVEPTVYEKQ